MIRYKYEDNVFNNQGYVQYYVDYDGVEMGYGVDLII